MRLVIQRVSKAGVSVNGKRVSEIGLGILVLVGIKKGDTQINASYLAGKLTKLRVMNDEKKKMNLSVTEVKGEILLVSQFTLYGDTGGGNRPSFIEAEEWDKAKTLFDYFVSKVNELYPKVKTGSYGDYMEIDCTLDGPVTIIIDSKK